MVSKLRGAGGAGLERLCGAKRSDWLRSRELSDGVQLLQAWFAGHGFDKHRHDTYAIGVTDVGVQAFDYRGAAQISTPGQVVVLHPDETHDGRAGTPEGFGYRIVYVAPARIHEAARAIRGRAGALPFVREPVTANETLASAIEAAFRLDPEPLAIDGLILCLAEALLDADPSCGGGAAPIRLDGSALARARQFLDAETTRVIRSSRARGGHRADAIRPRPAVPRGIRHQPLSLFPDAASRLRTVAATPEPIAGRRGTGRWLCRSGASLADVQVRLRRQPGALPGAGRQPHAVSQFAPRRPSVPFGQNRAGTTPRKRQPEIPTATSTRPGRQPRFIPTLLSRSCPAAGH